MTDHDSGSPEKIAVLVKGKKRVLSYKQAFSYGHMLCRAGRYSEADQLYDALIQIRPSDRQAMIMRARCQAGMERFEQSKKILKYIFATTDVQVPEKLHGAFVFMQMGLHTEAAEELSVVVHRHPSLATAWLALGDVLALTGDLAKAESCWKQAIKKDNEAGPVAWAARQQITRFQKRRAEPDAPAEEK